MAPSDAVPDIDKISSEAQTSSSTRRVAQLTGTYIARKCCKPYSKLRTGHLAPATETEEVNTRPTLPIDYPVSKHQIQPDRFIDDVRKLKVAVIGAGLSGINAGIILPAKVPNIDLTIFEKNDDVVSPPGCLPC